MTANEGRDEAWEKLLGQLPDFKRGLPEVAQAFIAGFNARPPLPAVPAATKELIEELRVWAIEPEPDRFEMVPAATLHDLTRRALVALEALTGEQR